MNMLTWDSTKRVKCSQCRGEGRGTTYLGMAGDHDGKPWTCNKCRGEGHVPRQSQTEPLRATLGGPDSPPDADLARELRARSGAAYGQGDDARAIRLRNAADLIEGKVTGPYVLEPNPSSAVPVESR